MRASVLSFVALFAVVFAAAGDAGAPAPADRIVFSSTRGPNVGNLEIYSVRTDGSGRLDLSRSQGPDSAASPSPNGRLIAYVSVVPRERGERWSLTVMRPDGSHKHVLTPDSLTAMPDSQLSWSPDGRTIAFTADAPQGQGIFSVHSDGSGLTQLVLNAAYPRWEPHGNRVAFIKTEFASGLPYQRVGVVRADGAGEKLLTNGPNDDAFAWAPAGRTLAFVRGELFDREIYTVSADTGGERSLVYPLTESISTIAWAPGKHILFSGSHVWSVAPDGSGLRKLAEGGSPVPSPDGRRIAFVSGHALRVMRADGADKRVVLPLGREFVFQEPAWASGRLLFSSERNPGRYELWTAKSGGGGLERLTHTATNEVLPQWSPDRKRLAFVRTSDPYGPAEGDSAIWVSDAHARHARRIGPGTYPSWSPHGDELVFSRNSILYRVKLVGGRPKRIGTGDAPVWSPRGGEIAFVQGPRVMILDLHSNQIRMLIDLNPLLACEDVGATVAPPEWSPSGQRLLLSAMCDRGRTPTGITVFVTRTGSQPRVLPGDAIALSRPAWSPGGGRIAVKTGFDRGTSIVSEKLDGSDRLTVEWSSADDRDPDW